MALVECPFGQLHFERCCYLVFLCLVVYLARKNSILCIFCVTKDARTFILHFLIAILRKKSRHEKRTKLLSCIIVLLKICIIDPNFRSNQQLHTISVNFSANLKLIYDTKLLYSNILCIFTSKERKKSIILLLLSSLLNPLLQNTLKTIFPTSIQLNVKLRKIKQESILWNDILKNLFEKGVPWPV